MKLLRWAVGGASAYVIYKYSIGRKARGEDVFVTPEKAVKQITGEPEPAGKPTARKPSARKPASAKAPKAPQADALSGDAPAPEKPKRMRAPRKKPAGE
ncbi:hypothetical protein SAMN05518801_102337 [Novosphingobium sp. CF614]|uniref:hypothetical protein n=1 Tax=Novosphingobium sp. CF614 TaxID=1884364 RepID=UPI0008ED8FD1|nr:hypothetical protein [Novosphingobium sp. CF614]SFF87030.1 hypothetical protein SAMN05518801_102337 [Novosphingobium sp. CF614]